MFTLFHEGRKIMVTEIGNHNYAEIADFLFFRVSGSKYIENGKRFFLLPNLSHLIEHTGFTETIIKNALSHLKKNNWIITRRKRCVDGAVRSLIFISDKLNDLMALIKNLKTTNQCPNNDSIIDEPKNDQNSENSSNTDSSKSNQSDSKDSDQSYIKEQSKKEKNNNVNNTESKVVKEQPYQNNVSNVNSDLDFLKAYESPEYNQLCRSIIDLVSEDNQVCNAALGMTILDLAEINIYTSAKHLVDDAISITKHLDHKDTNSFPRGDNKSLGKILKAAHSQRMEQLTPVQLLGITKMLDYLEAKKGVYLTNRNEVFSWIAFQLTNPEYHLKDLTFRHALNVIAKSLQKSGAQGYSKPFGYAA